MGVGLLVGGAELLVRGASRLAGSFGVSPLVVGLTVVAFGTSAPELAVSVQASFEGRSDLAFGNVVGSNIANILLILGLAAVVTPLVVSRQLVRLDVPLMIAASVLLYLMALDGSISRVEGIVLFIGVVTYTTLLIRYGRRETALARAEAGIESAPPGGPWVANAALVAVGLGLLVLGSRWLVNGAVAIATALGVSELIIGLTVVAVGTSMPEIATSVLASIRGERDIAVGNAIGSNLYNILSVLGITAIVAPNGIGVPQEALNFDLPVMLATAAVCFPIFFTGFVVRRWEGVLFLGYYAAYTVYLILDATGHQALPEYSLAMGLFVIPLTAAALGALVLRKLRPRPPE